MARKSERRIRHYAEYIAARGALFLFSLPPLAAARWLGRRIGDVWRLLDRRHRELAERQSEARLGLSPAAARRFARENFRHYGMLLAEFAKMTRLGEAAILDLVGPEAIRELRGTIDGLLAEGKGLLLISAHFGNWELSQVAGRVGGVEGVAIARPLDNPFLDAYVRRVREKYGFRILDKGGGFRQALRALGRNACVGILSDQDSGQRALLIPFFGLTASTTTVPAEMALRTGAPMMVGLLRRNCAGGGYPFSFRLSDPIRLDPGAEPNAEVRRAAAEMNSALEKIIAETPEQWFWVHRRWKSREVREKTF